MSRLLREIQCRNTLLWFGASAYIVDHVIYVIDENGKNVPGPSSCRWIVPGTIQMDDDRGKHLRDEQFRT